ncbi:hypothetical protein BY996DRAFT_943930 [Phakopsora pachyrhizi]|nr:hypothetical protein BY996DRAFT_943930 [Phakopsora pachyrhizi]
MMFFKYKPHKGLSSHPNHWLQEFKNHKSHRSQDHRTEGRKSSTIGLKNGDGSQSDTCSEESFVAGEFEDELEWQSGPQQGLPLISKNSGKGIEHMIPAKKDLFQLTNPNPWSMQSLPRINARSNFSKITPKSEENLNRKTAQVYPVGMPARRLFDQRTKQLPQLPSPDGRESSKPYFKYSASHQENRGPLKQNFLLAEGDQQQVGYSATADGKNKKYQPVVDSALRGSHEKVGEPI